MATFREFQKLLNESLINPKSPDGIIRIIMENDNPDYYIQRSVEYLREAQLVLKNCYANDKINMNNYHDIIRKVISLLVLARLKRKIDDTDRTQAD